MPVNAAFWDLLAIEHLTPARKTPKRKQSLRLHVNGAEHRGGLGTLLFILNWRLRGAASR